MMLILTIYHGMSILLQPANFLAQLITIYGHDILT